MNYLQNYGANHSQENQDQEKISSKRSNLKSTSLKRNQKILTWSKESSNVFQILTFMKECGVSLKIIETDMAHVFTKMEQFTKAFGEMTNDMDWGDYMTIKESIKENGKTINSTGKVHIDKLT